MNRLTTFSRRILVPLFLLTCCPPFVILLWHAHVHLGGSLSALLAEIGDKGLLSLLSEVWGPVFFGTPTAWAVIGVFSAVQLALMRLVPGARFEGPITPKGHIPVYKANGPACFAITLGLFWLTAYPLALFDPAIVFKNFGGILGALNVFALVFCLALYFKGRYAPSGPDSGTSGNFIFDYYWGTELYPRVWGWDLKQFTNCRFGMMGWSLIIWSFAAAQAETHGLSDSMAVAVILQLVYIAKFFWWETGYLRSLDIMHDRAGFYICWGCLVWLPCVYTSATLFLVGHPNNLGWPLAILITVLGVVSIFINYMADRQRQKVRATGGDCNVWGKRPVLIEANYTTEGGEAKKNLLLASGWWGISRHFHYVPELLGAFFWTVPALFTHSLPYFYVVFLAILLTDRAFRDEKRCATKYGSDWNAYCDRVRYKIIPGLV